MLELGLESLIARTEELGELCPTYAATLAENVCNSKFDLLKATVALTNLRAVNEAIESGIDRQALESHVGSVSTAGLASATEWDKAKFIALIKHIKKWLRSALTYLQKNTGTSRELFVNIDSVDFAKVDTHATKLRSISKLSLAGASARLFNVCSEADGFLKNKGTAPQADNKHRGELRPLTLKELGITSKDDLSTYLQEIRAMLGNIERAEKQIEQFGKLVDNSDAAKFTNVVTILSDTVTKSVTIIGLAIVATDEIIKSCMEKDWKA